MKKEVKVSVITVCLNSRNTIEQAIQSVLNQTYPNVEYIIVDGGSTDGTIDIIEKYEASFAGRLKWVSEPDKGIYDAINKGIRMSSGEIIGVLSSDDWYEEDALEKVIEHYDEKYPYQIIYGMTRTIKDNRELSITFTNHEFLETEMLCHEACFISRRAYKLTGLYSLKYEIGSDLDLLLRMKKHDEVKFIPIHEILVNFRLGGVSSKCHDETLLEHFKIRARHSNYSKRKCFFYIIWFKIKIAIKKLLGIC